LGIFKHLTFKLFNSFIGFETVWPASEQVPFKTNVEMARNDDTISKKLVVKAVSNKVEVPSLSHERHNA